MNTPANLRAAVKRIGQKFEILQHDNFLMSPRRTGYRAVHVQVRLDNRISAEIQIIPTPVKKVSNDQREFFEEWRDTNLTREERAKYKEALKRSNEAFEEAFDLWMEGKPRR